MCSSTTYMWVHRTVLQSLLPCTAHAHIHIYQRRDKNDETFIWCTKLLHFSLQCTIFSQAHSCYYFHVVYQQCFHILDSSYTNFHGNYVNKYKLILRPWNKMHYLFFISFSMRRTDFSISSITSRFSGIKRCTGAILVELVFFMDDLICWVISIISVAFDWLVVCICISTNVVAFFVARTRHALLHTTYSSMFSTSNTYIWIPYNDDLRVWVNLFFRSCIIPFQFCFDRNWRCWFGICDERDVERIKYVKSLPCFALPPGRQHNGRATEIELNGSYVIAATVYRLCGGFDFPCLLYSFGIWKTMPVSIARIPIVDFLARRGKCGKKLGPNRLRNGFCVR